MAGNARLLGLAVVLFLSAASPAAARTQACASGPLIQHWNGTGWTQVASPGGDALKAVAALSSSDVWALGVPMSRPFAQRWDGSAWQPVAMSRPVHWPGLTADISAPAAIDVWALVGRAVEHWDGSAWSLVPARLYGELSGIAALSPTNVWTVGIAEFADSGKRFRQQNTLVLHWNGSVWKRVRSPNPAVANPPGSRDQNGLYDVAAASPQSVWAVGEYYLHAKSGRHSWQPLVLHWNGKTWKVVPSASPGGVGHPASLDGVAVAGPNDVWAVGEYGIGDNVKRVLVEHWDGRRWSVVPAPSGYAFSSDQALSDLSVVAPDDIWASGYVLTDNASDIFYQGLVEHWDGSAWTVVPSLHQWDNGDSIGGIAATSSDDVWAVGGWATCS